MKKSIITMMVLMLTCAAWAQDVCYLVGTDGKKEANKASVTLTKESNGVFKVGEVVHIGTLQFLAPLTCEKVDNMKMRVTGLTVRGKQLPPLEIQFKLNK